ncbi:hypothetical protein RvY_11624 [Ramazzottius varieornatus]|uniref:Uncharacterized protein n=1 Tax=Ramazzottius varieornatus TaxID=947166 RepID=A0A1D1VGT4_RAMVA|nr:hypothetical protein RvY_11624 [Ramazzottius varieornatus]
MTAAKCLHVVKKPEGNRKNLFVNVLGLEKADIDSLKPIKPVASFATLLSDEHVVQSGDTVQRMVKVDDLAQGLVKKVSNFHNRPAYRIDRNTNRKWKDEKYLAMRLS